jgi:hypothetical protein
MGVAVLITPLQRHMLKPNRPPTALGEVCQLLALSGQSSRTCECLLSGQERTWVLHRSDVGE